MTPTRLQVAAYIGRSFVSRCIQTFTRAGFHGPSHVAIRDSFTGLVYEAWETAGCRILPHLGQGHCAGTTVHLYNWILSDEDVNRVLTFCNAQIGKKYDLLGILGFITKAPRDDLSKWFCSEMTVAASQLTRNPILTRTSPRNAAPVHVCWSPVLIYQLTVMTTLTGHMTRMSGEPKY